MSANVRVVLLFLRCGNISHTLILKFLFLDHAHCPSYLQILTNERACSALHALSHLMCPIQVQAH